MIDGCPTGDLSFVKSNATKSDANETNLNLYSRGCDADWLLSSASIHR